MPTKRNKGIRKILLSLSVFPCGGRKASRVGRVVVQTIAQRSWGEATLIRFRGDATQFLYEQFHRLDAVVGIRLDALHDHRPQGFMEIRSVFKDASRV